jgi:hypothetical protein
VRRSYNIQMALMHNYNYWARRADTGGEEDPVIEVYDDSGVLAAVTLSADGRDWAITAAGRDPAVLPRQTPPAALADAIVREVERSD